MSDFRPVVIVVFATILLTGVAGGVFPASEPAPVAEAPGWQGDGHELVSNRSIPIGEELSARVADAVRTPDGGRIIVGFRRFQLRAFTDDRIATAWRLGPDGAVQWQVDLAANESRAVDIVTTTNGYAVAGVQSGEAFLIRLSGAGDVTDRLTVDRDSAVRIGGLAATPNGGVIMVGYETLNAPDRPFSQIAGGLAPNSGWALRMDDRGTVVWERSLGAIPRDIIAHEGGYIMVGQVEVDNTPDEPGNTTTYPWLQRFEGPESVVWNRTWPVEDAIANRIAPADGGFVVGGQFDRFDRERREQFPTLAVFGAGQDGSHRYTRVLPETDAAQVTGAVSLPDGSVALVATTNLQAASNIGLVTADTSGVTGAALLGSVNDESVGAVWPMDGSELSLTGDLERGGQAERRNLLLLGVRVTGIATPVMRPSAVPRDRGDVTLTPTTTLPDVVTRGTADEQASRTQNTATADDRIVSDPSRSGGLPLLGIAVYMIPFVLAAAVLIGVRQRLR